MDQLSFPAISLSSTLLYRLPPAPISPSKTKSQSHRIKIVYDRHHLPSTFTLRALLRADGRNVFHRTEIFLREFCGSSSPWELPSERSGPRVRHCLFRNFPKYTSVPFNSIGLTFPRRRQYSGSRDRWFHIIPLWSRKTRSEEDLDRRIGGSHREDVNKTGAVVTSRSARPFRRIWGR